MVSSETGSFLTAKNEKGGVLVLWTISFNYKVVYDKGTTSVYVNKLRAVLHCETGTSAI